MVLNWQLTPHNSTEYMQALSLRDAILRKPLGLAFDPDDLCKEGSDWHFVGLIDGLVQACCILTAVPTENSVKMRQVAVSEALQGQGIGRQLVHVCESWAAQNQITSIELNARQTAVPFYLHLGYELVGEEFVEVGLPHRHMRKLIDSCPAR